MAGLSVETELEGDNVEDDFEGVESGAVTTPIMLAMLEIICLRTGGDIASAYMPE
jgi:hypothetical protein